MAKVVVTEKGALFIACLISVALASYAAARVASLKDHIDLQSANQQRHTEEQQQINQQEIEHYKEQFAKLERQYRMTELKYDDVSVVLHRAGLIIPGDYTRGPQGDLDAESFHIHTKGK